MNRGLLGVKLADLRKARGFSQTELADRTDVSRTTINNIEKGEQSLTLELFIRISDALSYDAPALLRILQEPQDIIADAKDAEDLKIREIIDRTIQSPEGIENNNN